MLPLQSCCVMLRPSAEECGLAQTRSVLCVSQHAISGKSSWEEGRMHFPTSEAVPHPLPHRPASILSGHCLPGCPFLVGRLQGWLNKRLLPFAAQGHGICLILSSSARLSFSIASRTACWANFAGEKTALTGQAGVRTYMFRSEHHF